MTKTTLIYLFKGDQVLFMRRDKKSHDINKDKYIGIGGHLEKDETIIDCLKREVKEETGLSLISYEFKGIIDFVNQTYENESMYLFTGSLEEGELINCNEGTFVWINKKDILSLPLWEGDKYFLPLINVSEKEKYFKMTLIYDGDTLKSVLGPKYDSIKEIDLFSN